MKRNNKELLFERMEYINPDFKRINESIDINKLNKFVGALPDNFPEIVKKYSMEKDIGLDSAYYNFIGAFLEKLGLDDFTDDELDELDTIMYGRFGDNAIEF